MITRDQMESERAAYLERSMNAQIEQIGDTLERIAGAVGEPASLDAARDDVDRLMAYTEWTATVLEGHSSLDALEAVVDCHRLMGRLRGAWQGVESSSDLRGWIRWDVAQMRDRLRQTTLASA